MKRTIRLNESELKRMISESVRRVLNEGQYEKGYDSGQFLIKTRIDRYGDAEGRQKIKELYYKMLNNLENSKEYGLKTIPFVNGQFDSIEKYLESTGI